MHYKKKEKEGFQHFQADVQKKMIAAIDGHVKEHKAPDFTAITGDISFDGKEYKKANEFFSELKAILPTTIFLPVPGNHDVNRNEIFKHFSLYDIVKNKEVDAFLESKKEIETFVNPKFKHFSEFSDTISPGLYEKEEDYFWVRNFPKRKVSFLGLNSAWACEGDNDRNNITLGFPQVIEAFNKSKEIPNRIILMHHPFNWLNERDFSKCESKILKNSSLILHGHTHTDRATVLTFPDYCCVCLSANASYTIDDDGFVGFQFINIKFKSKGVLVEAWPYIFDEKRRWDFVPDRERYEKQDGKKYFVINVLPGILSRIGSKDQKRADQLDHENIFKCYKHWALNEHRHLPMKGFETNMRAPIEIEQVYVTMRAHIQFRDFDLMTKGGHKIKEGHEGEQLSDLDIKGTLKAAQKHKIKDIVILGDPGSGKTTLLKYILVMLIEGRGGEKLGLDTNPVPFFAPLRELKDPDMEDFFDFMYRVNGQEKFSITKEDFKNLLQAGRGIVLLDGLDEVADEKTRIKTCKWIDDARKILVNTPFIITSRFAGYLGDSRLESGVLELSILDFSPDEVEAFLVRWFETVEMALHPGDDNEEHWRLKGREEALKLVKNINDSEHIRKLAVNPLMLQIIALIRFDRGTKLPERRVELYNECVNVLLEKWDIARGLDSILNAQQSRFLLQPIALWLHEKEERRSAPLEEIIGRIKEPLERLGKSDLDPEKLLLNIRDRSGIFLGYSESEYGFAHLGFQEYLAAEEIRNNYPIDILVDHYGNRWWREVTLLALALENPSIIMPFMERFVQTEAFKTDITLICDAVKDSVVKPYKPFIDVLNNEKVSIEVRQNAVRVLAAMGGETAVSALTGAVADKNLTLSNAAYQALESLQAAEGIEPPKRAEAPAIIEIEKDVSQMVLIPEGNFIYGSREDDKEANQDEKPQQTIYLPSFYMDIYPVTNSQYSRFLSGVKPTEEELNKWIDLSGKMEKEKCRIIHEGNEFIVERGYANHPVIYVSWFGAETYAKWVGKRLPNEVEWEKAARGTDGRKYPWGNEFEIKLCNSAESGTGHTTPVTDVPNGKSPYGCFDMAGNVWEWCADWYDDNNDKIGVRLHEAKDGEYRVLRGGSWFSIGRYVRSAIRLHTLPSDRWRDAGLRLAKSL
jgi:formylglycine-generating enzyme required for sulfatase activity/calcineurin-like phosphoesterase family protein